MRPRTSPPAPPSAHHPAPARRPAPHSLWAAVPVLAFLATPFLPFVSGPHLWLGLPSVLVWCVLWTVGTSAALALVEHLAHSDEYEEDEVHEDPAPDSPARSPQEVPR
ncbi:hypothetical protein ACIO3O_01450 [Streptomyces sp. NPDC087440]|uniref:hypothetical protein n=1 Tax=Streptomyces sp. NPDC087440 TaxID=3365790 RepID=UPI0038239068